MNRKEALEMVKEQLNEARYTHTVGVMETAIKLAEKYGEDVKKAELAAIFHDYAKFRPKDEMKEIIIEQNMSKDLLEHHHSLWHAPVGAYLVQKEVGIEDEAVLRAIEYHTYGRPNMTMLEKIVYVADYIEPGRSFPGVEEVRQSAENSLDEALFLCLRNTIVFLIGRKQPIYPMTINTYNSLVQ
ncbi:bis(5'-nucleosyl)-tetraphosphatase (symmetrical) YqeK [Priestia endophytica]|jgi:predicted HD superfamily hydrolase involved in NAD metabolism|uniref:bis(5'-nucleosyl)-tetraphosphatase (symmetrical) YqeK n=1 Tax=Priestia endophytica TaxID=135735 RepID=UPI000F532C47|nr:bis(5'-nucleosyl)-tetraphosphatase (symmetrical) YqeK [Priestia endophytica]RPK15818.1 hypothetical protein FH5_01257 [Priestia endophytica]